MYIKAHDNLPVVGRSKSFSRKWTKSSTETEIRETLENEFADLVAADKLLLGSRIRVVTTDAPPPDLIPELLQTWYTFGSLGTVLQMARDQEFRTSSAPYDWFVVTRFDIAHLSLFPGLTSFSDCCCYLPYVSLPVSDIFALIPRQHVDEFHMAVSSNLSNISSDFPPGAGPTEVILLRYLREHGVSIRLYDFPVSISRTPPDSLCQGLPTHKIGCIQLVGSGYYFPWKSHEECERLVILSHAVHCNEILEDEHRGEQLANIISERIEIEAEMARFLSMFNSTPDSAVVLPVRHTILLGASQDVISGNNAVGFGSPQGVALEFFQDDSSTVELKEAFACLFINHLAGISSIQLAAGHLNVQDPQLVNACASHGEVTRRFHIWMDKSWSALQSFSLPEPAAPAVIEG